MRNSWEDWPRPRGDDIERRSGNNTSLISTPHGRNPYSLHSYFKNWWWVLCSGDFLDFEPEYCPNPPMTTSNRPPQEQSRQIASYTEASMAAASLTRTMENPVIKSQNNNVNGIVTRESGNENNTTTAGHPLRHSNSKSPLVDDAE